MATVRIQVRRGTASQWTSANPTLAAGELGVESDTNLFKFGNGSTAWTSLAYANNSDVAIGEISQDAINSALTMGAGLTKTYNDGANTITIAVDASYFNELAQDAVNTALTAGAGITKTYDDTANTITVTVDSTVATLSGTQTLSNKTLTSPVINTPTGITKSDVGLGSVDNTGDMAKPVSNAAQSAFDLKAPIASPTFTGNVNGITKTMVGLSNVDNTADTAKPVSAAQATAIATAKSEAIADATSQVNAVIAGAPAALDTLDELAAALGDDANYAATITTSLSGKLAKAGDTMTGALTLSGAPTSNLHASTKGYVDSLGNTGIAYVDTHANKTTAVHGITDTAELATKTYANNVGSTASADATTKANAAQSAAISSAATTADSKIATHNSDTTDVHGIADTALLATTASLTAAIATEVTNRNTAIQSTLGTHEADTTDVHGIANTSLLATTANISAAITQEVSDRNTAIGTSISTHSNTTTSVHGIANTANLVATTDTGSVTSAMILNGTIVDADVNASAAIAQSKISGLTADLALKSPLASPTFTGTVTLPAGTITSGMILDGTIVDADVNAAAAIAQSKISGLTSSFALKADLASPTFTGTVSGVTKAMVGLGNVDNTADSAKPVSTATQTALDAKLASATAATNYETITNVALKAPLASPALTGVPTAPTAAAGTNTTQVATTAFVGTAVSNLVASAPAALDTLNELATALGNDASFSTTISTSIGLKAPIASPTFTGTVSGVTKAMVGLGNVDNTADSAKPVSTATQTALDAKLASTTAASTYAPLASPTFTGTVTVAASGVAFMDGTQTKAGVPSLTTTTTTISGAYNLSSGGLTLRDQLVNIAGAFAVTVPTNATTAYPIGTSIDFWQSSGAGGASFAPVNGTVTILSTPGSTLRALYSSATLTKVSTDAWLLAGDLKA